MSKLRKNLQLEMEKRDWNDYKLSEKSGVPQPTIHRFLSGAHGEPRGETVRKIARGLGISEAQLRGFEGLNKTELNKNETDLYSTDIISSHNFEVGNVSRIRNAGRVPLISSVQAGEWSEAIDLFEVGDAADWLICPVSHGDRAYCLKVDGDSMTSPHPGIKSYPEGTIIYVDPDVEPVSGKRVIAKLPHTNEATFKEYRVESGKHWLKPLNPQYPTIEVTEDVHICGVVIFSGSAE